MNQAEKGIKKYYPLLSAVALNLVILIIAICFSHMRFGTNDDRDVSNLLANVSGTGNGHYISFMNIIFTKGMSCLYTWTNNVTNWYVLLCVVFSFIALTCICELIIRRSSSFWIGLGLSVIVASWSYQCHYIIFQFTHNAALYTLTGMLMLGDGIIHEHRRRSWISWVIGCFFLFLGSIVRFQSVYFSAPYLCLMIGYEMLFRKDKTRFIPWLRLRWRSMVVLAVGFLLVFSARFVHLKFYQSKASLNDYITENNLRAELLDYGVPDYDDHKQEYDSIGLHEKDVVLFTKHTCIDKEVFSRQVLEAMVEMKDVRGTDYSFNNLTITAFPAVWNSIIESADSIIVWCLLLAVLLFYLVCTSLKRIPILLISMLLPLGMTWYFVSMNRMPFRVWYSIVLPALVTICYVCSLDYCSLNERKPHSFRRVIHIIGIILFSVIALAAAGKNVREAVSDDSSEITDTYEKILEFAKEHPDTLVLLDRPTVTPLTYSSTITPMTCLERDSHHNICYQGGWICWTPGNYSVLKNFKIKNPYRAIGDGLEVYLIDSVSSGKKLDFIRRHYNKQVALEKIGTIEGSEIGIYRFFIPNQ